MPQFYYKAKSFGGELKEDTAEAKDEHELAQKLRLDGWLLLHAKEGKRGSRAMSGFSSLFAGISVKDKMFFAKNLGSMLEAGLPFARALSVLANQTSKKSFKKIIKDIEKNVRGGDSFSQALGQYGWVFDDFFLSMVEMGENTGNLDKALKLIADQMKKDYEIRSKIKGAMIYPAVIVTVMVIVGVVMMVVLVPKLAATFKELKVELPPATKIVVWLGSVFSNYLILMIVVVVAVVIASLLFFKKTSIGQNILHWVFLHLPGLKGMSQKINCARFSRTMGALLAGGVPIVKSLEISSRTLSNVYFRSSIMVAKQDVQKGDQLSKSISAFPKLYPSMVLQMIEVGEESGIMDKTFNDLATFYEEEISEIIKNISSLIEPVIMILVGLGVGFFAVAMIQPLYGIIKVV